MTQFKSPPELPPVSIVSRVPPFSIHVALTVMAKTPRTDTYGEVRWYVRILNQDSDVVAEYQLLTMNAFEHSSEL